MSKKEIVHDAQKITHKFVAILRGKSFDESHWELIIGFTFFFGGLFLLASYFAA